MKAYPETYTMWFGEKECPECGGLQIIKRSEGNRVIDRVCPECDGLGTIPISVTFELTKECPECQGKGDHYVFDDGVHHPCPHCSNNGLPKGKVPRYWTPDEAAKEIKAMTGTDWEWPDDTLIRHLLKNSRAWHSSLLRNIHDWVPKVLAFPGQPAPPENWRPGGDIKELTNG